MTRRTVGLGTLAMAMAVAVGACSSGPSSSSDSWGEAETIKIGVIQPMTGAFAVLGTVVNNSIQVEVDRINSSGGLGGARLEVVTRDMQLDPAKAVQFSNELARDPSVKLVVGPSITAFYQGARPVFEETSMLNCQPAVASQDWASLRVGFQAQDQPDFVVERLLEYLQSKGITRAGMVEVNDDGGRAYHELFVQLAPKYGVTIVDWQQSRADDQSHLAYVQALMEKDVEAIWASNAGTGALTFAAAKQSGYTGTLMTGNGLSSLPNIEATGEMLGQAVFVAGGFRYAQQDRNDWPAGYRAWAEALEDKYGYDTGSDTGVSILRGIPQAADCVRAFAAAAEAAQSFDRDKIAAAMETISIPASDTPSGCEISPGEDHSFYDKDCTRVYEWVRSSDKWFTQDVTPSS